MKTLGEYLGGKMIRVASVAALAAVMSLGVVAPSANAQVYDRGRAARIDRNDIQRVALINGYGDGYEQGMRDRRSRSRFQYQGIDKYRTGRGGYDANWRLEREYQNWYRQGFQRGYSDSFYGKQRNRDYDRGRFNRYQGYYGNQRGYYTDDRDGNRDRDDVARDAARNGYSAGFERGQYDAQRRNRPNPQGHGAYQFGYDGFDPDWGWASTYQQSYRQYFVQGYQDAYNRRSFNRNY